ncbi:DNA-directed RNA polymerase [Synchytrium microbalum]|uniref:DNA-directed RNA polymerase subunit beta n=1 Tax=Synchytrium microbalum TaxID=1806994 RepID=A0A507BWZ5_9FUNG|nr:DNA-directed RNA polymerase [Synchytrium microbalum]TPX33860.1 DNA-directed RNA polymerase [Synchytrium microbalum]
MASSEIGQAPPSKAEKRVGSFENIKRETLSLNPSDKKPHYARLSKISAPHVESFNALFQWGTSTAGLIDKAVADIGHRVMFDTPVTENGPGERGRNRLEMWIANVNIGKPSLPGTKGAVAKRVLPSECRERGISYRAQLQFKICWTVNGGPVQAEVKTAGYLPILVRSTRCHLDGKSPKELIKMKEDPDEFGGYFIVNGIERLIRLLIVPRRNNATAIIRTSFQKRGPTYTPFGVAMRSVRHDQTSQTITLHYCTDGAITIRFIYRKQEFMVPYLLVLKALKEVSDKEIFEKIMMGRYHDSFLTDRVELLLRSFRRYPVSTRKSCLAYLGSKFAVMLDSADDATEEQVGLDFLKQIILVHLESPRDKFDVLIFMLQKLYSLVAGECSPDNPDAPNHQEVLLGGFLYVAYMKEKIGDILTGWKSQIQIDLRKNAMGVNFHDRKYLLKALSKVNIDIGKKMEYFLATGNLVTNSGLDLQQTSGYTIVAEKLNFLRYLSHFRSIHRGAFFAELKTTTVRKLLPEAWGFLCPVHTPDGSPCGLLNHLSHSCRVVTHPIDTSTVPNAVAELGVLQTIPALGDGEALENGDDRMDVDDDNGENLFKLKARQERTILTIFLDGRVVGYCTAKCAEQVSKTLRLWKVKGIKGIPMDLEIGWVPPSKGGQYPGLFLFSAPARMMRPVKYIPTGTVDMVGTFEQVYMDVACLPEDIVPGLTTHIEVAPTNMLSVIANMTPFSDFNQSPRNMYQCQMGKQSMGTAAHNLPHRTDNKLYRIVTPQVPIVKPSLYEEYGMDSYPNGMNAVVAVISYTGYDMEDAMIIARSSHDRGFGHGIIYKGEFVDLSDMAKRGEPCYFGLKFRDGTARGAKRAAAFDLAKVSKFLDIDGLPHIGVKLTAKDPMYAYVDEAKGMVKVVNYKGSEDVYVDQVNIVGCDETYVTKVFIKLRVPRSPIVGDKFSSRHGQKGVMSQRWPSVDMPFSESGIIPDVIINPHAFPSRMTIGMFVESLAGKSGAMHGISQDATPFTFSETNIAADYFGEELRQSGYNYHGNEPMYSGITGEEFKADIYLGVVYYQRLRHMVSDKFQVRTTGPVHNLTQQPVKGRKRAGGIRFGEMERDSLLAHGVSFLLQDRLMNCSDYSQQYVCSKCGSLLSTMSLKPQGGAVGVLGPRERVVCRSCGTGKHVSIIAVPYVFRYLCTELVAMNVKIKLELQ